MNVEQTAALQLELKLSVKWQWDDLKKEMQLRQEMWGFEAWCPLNWKSVEPNPVPL